MITHTPPLAGYLPIKTLVARQQPTNVHAIFISWLVNTKSYDILLTSHDMNIDMNDMNIAIM